MCSQFYATMTQHDQKAFQIADTPPVPANRNPGLDLDMLINSLKDIVDESGLPKFPLIVSMFQAVAFISHGNSAPESGFSINKYMLKLHGNSLAPDTMEAIRFVKDTILSYGGFLEVPVTKPLLESAKLTYSRFNADLEAKRKLQEKEKERQSKEADDEQKHMFEAERNTLIASIQQVSSDVGKVLKLHVCSRCSFSSNIILNFIFYFYI